MNSIFKPVSPKDLLKQVREVLDNSKASLSYPDRNISFDGKSIAVNLG